MISSGMIPSVQNTLDGRKDTDKIYKVIVHW